MTNSPILQLTKKSNGEVFGLSVDNIILVYPTNSAADSMIEYYNEGASNKFIEVEETNAVIYAAAGSALVAVTVGGVAQYINANRIVTITKVNPLDENDSLISYNAEGAGVRTYTSTQSLSVLIAESITGNSVINAVAGASATINALSGRFTSASLGATFVLTNNKLTANSCIVATFGTSAATNLELAGTKVVPASAVAASGTITYTGAPVAAETVTIGGVVFTFRAAATLETEITIGGTVTATAENTVAVVNDSTSVLLDGVVLASNIAGVVTIDYLTPGTGGNAFTLAESATNTAVSGATLSGGLNALATFTFDTAPNGNTEVNFAIFN